MGDILTKAELKALERVFAAEIESWLPMAYCCSCRDEE